ncbi:hypothetical protein NKG94_35480 [Micromonospora sp. M12]
MAFVERRTGVRLPAEWMSDEGSTRRPGRGDGAARSFPADPRPPSNFGHYEPDLDARLRAAPEPVRRAALALAVRAVTTRFSFSDDDLVRRAVEAVEEGLSLDEETRSRIVRLRAHGADVRACSSAVHALHAAIGAGGRRRCGGCRPVRGRRRMAGPAPGPVPPGPGSATPVTCWFLR